jgi:hypothetical protein
MIALPNRLAASRTPAGLGAAAGPPEPAVGTSPGAPAPAVPVVPVVPADPPVAGSDGGDGDSLDARSALDARIAALVARATTPQDAALEAQREEFDFVTRVRAETERELNALRDMAMEQMKNDDELLKKWIALI